MSGSRNVKGQKMALTKSNALYTNSVLQSQTLLWKKHATYIYIETWLSACCCHNKINISLQIRRLYTTIQATEVRCFDTVCSYRQTWTFTALLSGFSAWDFVMWITVRIALWDFSLHHDNVGKNCKYLTEIKFTQINI